MEDFRHGRFERFYRNIAAAKDYALLTQSSRAKVMQAASECDAEESEYYLVSNQMLPMNHPIALIMALCVRQKKAKPVW